MLALALAFWCILPAFAENNDSVLRFGSDGKLKIMVFTDVHEGGTGGGEACLQIMREAMDNAARGALLRKA